MQSSLPDVASIATRGTPQSVDHCIEAAKFCLEFLIRDRDDLKEGGGEEGDEQINGLGEEGGKPNKLGKGKSEN